MTNTDAKKALVAGQTLTHPIFSLGQNIKSENDGFVTLQDGAKIPWAKFWEELDFLNGWEVVNKPASWHNTYMNIAETIALHSKDTDRKVGCIVVKDNRIISIGYNGTPHGFDNNCKDQNGKTKPEVIHAESNAITKCAKSTESIAGASMYSTLACCVECAKLIIQCEIKEFYYKEPWKNPHGLELLRQAGIKTEQV